MTVEGSDGEREPPQRRGDGDGEWLLVSDVDGTLTGDLGALAHLIETVSGRVRTVLNSSRPIASVRRTLLGFPGSWMPAGIIGALGTEIELDGRPVVEWGARFGSWDRDPIDAAMAGLGVAPHALEYQTIRKASFTVPADRCDEARRAVAATGVPSEVLVSGESDFDVVPPGAGKGPAASFVARSLGVAPDRVVTAGDALIDADLVRVGRGILVGNATDEVLAAAPGTVYRAKGVFAAGVLEGLVEHGALS